MRRFIGWLGIAASKFHAWRTRYGLANEHNALVPRDGWLEPWEKAAILDFHTGHALEGYRRLAFMMLDADVVAVSPSSVYRVLRNAGLMKAHNSKPSLKGKGFQQPLRAHEHWHVDISYINVAGTFFYLCSLLDGCSRFIVHWEIRESMTEADVETIIQRARERFPRRAAPDHLRQRAAVHRQGLQGVHQDLWNESCENITVLSPEQREDREVAQDAQGRMHPGQGAVEFGGRTAPRHGVRGALQRRPPAQRDRLRRARGQAGRSRSDDLRRAGSQAGGRTRAATRGAPAGELITVGSLPDSCGGPMMRDGLGGG